MTATETRLADVDMQTILSAWNDATDRLRRTHETLRDEVRRLTDELTADYADGVECRMHIEVKAARVRDDRCDLRGCG